MQVCKKKSGFTTLLSADCQLDLLAGWVGRRRWSHSPSSWPTPTAGSTTTSGYPSQKGESYPTLYLLIDTPQQAARLPQDIHLRKVSHILHCIYWLILHNRHHDYFKISIYIRKVSHILHCNLLMDTPQLDYPPPPRMYVHLWGCGCRGKVASEKSIRF